MFERVRYKELAKSQLTGKWGISAGSFLLLYLVVAAASTASMINPFLGNLLTYAVTGSILLGLCRYGISMVKGEQIGIETVFNGFRDFVKALLMYLWMLLWTFLWTLLFVIPGIIKGISYSMCFYILAENPEIGVREALNKSKELTDGYKWDLFVLNLSFIGWGLLCLLTCGIGFLWLVPYIQVTAANAYFAMKKAKCGNDGLLKISEEMGTVKR